MPNNDIEKVECTGKVWVSPGRIEIDQTPLDVLVAEAFGVEVSKHGLIKKTEMLGRARITIEVLPDP